MNKKGQALVEFIIIIPFIVMLIVTLFDFSKIIETKIAMENDLDEYSLNENYSLTGTLKEEVKDGKITYTLTRDVDITSIYLTPILGNKHSVSVQRTLYE